MYRNRLLKYPLQLLTQSLNSPLECQLHTNLTKLKAIVPALNIRMSMKINLKLTHDSDGQNTDGQNKDGHNKDGHNKDGHNKDGHNKDGHNKTKMVKTKH